MKKLHLILAAVLMMSACTLFSQEIDSPSKFNSRYGLFGGLNLNSHNADFTRLPGIPNCVYCSNSKGFHSADGMGLNFGLLYETPVYYSLLLGLRVGYFSLDGEFSPIENTTIIVNGKDQPAEIHHVLNLQMGVAGVEPMVMWNVYDYLFVSLGMNMGIPLTKKFDQYEKITASGATPTFYDSLGIDTHSSTRNSFSGDLPEASSFLLAGIAGLSYELPLNRSRSMTISPEVFYHYGFTPVITNYNWSINSLQFSLSLKYSPESVPQTIEEFKKIENIDTVTVQNAMIAENTFRTGLPLTKTEVNEIGNKIITTDFVSRTDTLFLPKKWNLGGSITAVGVDSTGREIANPMFVIEEFSATKLHPLLNYIFFDENSPDLPDRYNKLSQAETGSFEVDKLYSLETLPVYYHILNIVGSRLQTNPSAKMTITGCNSGTGAEKGNTALSLKRAEAVKNYLVSVWKIDAARLKTESRNLPEKTSTPIEEADKMQENRRVELYSDVESVLEPVFTSNTLRNVTPPVARFKPSVLSEAGLESASLVVSQGAKMFKQISVGDGRPYYDWLLNEDQNNVPRLTQPLEYKMNLKDTKSNVFNSPVQFLPLDQVTIQKKKINKLNDKEIEKFSLILFDFDKADISGRNTRIVKLIKDRIKPNSTIEIKGFTDRTGENDYNKNLSSKRAAAAQKSLSVISGAVEGIGEEFLLYNNDIPEGRFYSRTVEINVETPVEYK